MILEQLLAGIKQNLVVLFFCLLSYLFARLWHSNASLSFIDFIGLKPGLVAFNREFFWVWIFCLVVFSIFTYLQISQMAFMESLLKSPSSPYWKYIEAKPKELMTAFLYCILIAGFSEEILFRGLIGIRLVNFFGFWIGNVLQAFVFFLVHFLLVRFVVGSWFHPAQVIGFLASFPLALACGYLSYQTQPIQIWPAILLHSSANFCTYLVMVFAHRLGHFRG